MDARRLPRGRRPRPPAHRRRRHLPGRAVEAFDVPRPHGGPHGGPLDALELYRMLRVTNPAPYMYIFVLPSGGLIGASPEVLVRLDRRDAGLRVTLRPIAGTRPRGPDDVADAALAAELLADPKERPNT